MRWISINSYTLIYFLLLLYYCKVNKLNDLKQHLINDNEEVGLHHIPVTRKETKNDATAYHEQMGQFLLFGLPKSALTITNRANTTLWE